MSAYSIVLFVHVIGAIVVVGGSLFGFAMGPLSRTATTVDGLRTWTQVGVFLNRVVPIGALVTFLAGVYMVFAEWSWNTGWIVVSLVLFVLAGATAGKVIDPHWKALHAETTEAPAGPIPADLAAHLRDARASAFETMMLATDVAIVFLMTNKPGYVGSLAVVAVAWTAGLGLIVSSRRSSRPAAATEVA